MADDRQSLHQIRQEIEANWSRFTAYRPRGLVARLTWRWHYRHLFAAQRVLRREGARIAEDMNGDG